MQATRYFFWIILLVFLYQNCEVNEDGPSESGLNQSQEIEPVIELGNLNLEKPIALLVEDETHILHYDSGTVIGAERQDRINFCLSDEKLSALMNLIEEGKLCQLNNEIPEDTVCAMVYTFPFAGFFVDEEIGHRKVGEKINSCPKTTIEFCENNEEIESFISDLDFSQDFSQCLGSLDDLPNFQIAPVNPIKDEQPIFTF